jgi:NADPH:quinone reductase-like Zn-dependent oxidoreductase
MRAFAVEKFGDAPAIRELPIPAAVGEFLISVTYAGVNPFDYKQVDHLTATSSYPFVLGVDFAGVVERVPTDTGDIGKGDRIFGIARTHGAYAQYTAVAPGLQSEPLARIPDGVTDEQAAALPIPGVTAIGSLELLQISPGQQVVVMGATGGVGAYAVQIARARDARVIATVRGDVETARQLGADEVYDTNNDDVINAIRASHPGGIDAVLDLVNGAEAIRRDAEILKPGGCLVTTNYVADERWFAERKITAHNFASIKSPASSPQVLRELAHMVDAGTISVRISAAVGLDGAGQLLERLRNGGVRGKAVIQVASESEARSIV